MQGKLAVLGAVLKQDKLFTAADIGEESGVSRQLIEYHLKNFTANGYLEIYKVGYRRQYLLVNKENLIIEASKSLDFNESGAAKPTLFLKEKEAKLLNNAAKYVKLAKATEMVNSDQVRTRLLEEIEDTLKQMRRVKKDLMENRITYGSAAKKIIKENEENEDWQMNWHTLSLKLGLSSSESEIREAIMRLERDAE